MSDLERAKRNVRKLIASGLEHAPRGTQTRLADACGVAQPQVSRWKTVEGGTTPEQDRWSIIEEVLGLAAGELARAYVSEDPDLVYVAGPGLAGQFMRSDQVVALLAQWAPDLTSDEAELIVRRALDGVPESTD